MVVLREGFLLGTGFEVFWFRNFGEETIKALLRKAVDCQVDCQVDSR